MNKYFYDDIFISIELGRQSASTSRATSSISHIWNRCPFSYSTLRLTVALLSTYDTLLTPTLPLNDDVIQLSRHNKRRSVICKNIGRKLVNLLRFLKIGCRISTDQ